MTVCKVFVGNVPFNCTSEEFQGIFKNMTGYVNCELFMRQDKKMSRGSGYVTFGNESNAETLFKNGMTFKDRELRFSAYQENKKETTQHTFKLFVRNIPETMKREELVKIFSKYGRVGMCRISHDPTTGNPRGFGTVELFNKDSFKQLLTQKTVEHGGHVLNVYSFKTRSKTQPTANLFKAGFERGRLLGFQEGITSVKEIAK